MSKVKNGDKVQINYIGKLADGSVFDETGDGDLFEFQVGNEEVIPGLDEVLIGMEEGESKTVTIDPEKAYGPLQDEMFLEVDKTEFPENLTLEIGTTLEVEFEEEGGALLVSVMEIREETVILDANHPLAGEALTFEFKLEKVG